MVKALEASTELIANYQLQDMMDNAITSPHKFHNLGLRIKSPNVGEDIFTSCFFSLLQLRDIMLLLHILVPFLKHAKERFSLGVISDQLNYWFYTMKEISPMGPCIDSRFNASLNWFLPIPFKILL